MNTENILQPLQQLLAAANDLMQRVQAEGWEEQQEAFTDYQKKVCLVMDAHYLSVLKDANLAADAQALIVRIQDCNQQLDQHADKVHSEVASELRQFMQADKALDAYRR